MIRVLIRELCERSAARLAIGGAANDAAFGGFGHEWAGQSLQEKLSGSQAPFLLALSALVVFLCLAALYESWTIPLAVLLAVPLGILGAVVAASVRELPNDVYRQNGFAIFGARDARDDELG